MADVSMKDFLTQYYMQMHMQHMPSEVFATFQDYLKADDFRGNMKKWKDKKLVIKDPNPDNKRWIVNPDLPNPNNAAGDYHMTDEEWKKLFLAFQEAFQNMDADKGSFKENKAAKKYLNEWFGERALFSIAAANPTVDALIQGDFKNFLTAYRNQLELYLRDWGILTDDFPYSELLAGIASKKYNKNPKFQQKLILLSRYISRASQDDDFKRGIGAYGVNIPNFSFIPNGFDNTAVNPHKLAYFKNNYSSLLKDLYENKKVFDEFSRFDNGKITGQLTKAKSTVAYDDKNSKDYVPPKRQDYITPWQKFKDYVSDTYEDCFGKYRQLRGDHRFYSDSARLIFKALDGAKVKPTDGIDGILKASGVVKKNLQYKSATAMDHWDWFEKTLGELQSDGKFKKAYAGALRNGAMMEKLISEIIIKAVEQGKDKEAKTAMEILYSMRYGYTASKIMDAFSSQQFTLFSDGKYSWNNTDASKVITAALDKSIAFAFKSIGYTITFANNAIQRRRGKFNGSLGTMRGDYNRLRNEHAAEKDALNAELADLNAQKHDVEDEMNVLSSSGITEARLNAHISTHATNLEARTTDAKNKFEEILNQVYSTPGFRNDILEKIYGFAENAIRGIPADPTMLPATGIPTLQTKINELQDIAKQIRLINMALGRKQKKLKIFTDGADAIRMFDERITQINDKLSTWETDNPGKHKKYEELMAFWDFLKERGNSWIGSNTRGQAAFDKVNDAGDKKKEIMFAAYRARYRANAA